MKRTSRRIAANEVVVDGERRGQCVVEITSGTVTACYPLDGELPHTEWLGGTVVLRTGADGSLRAYKNENLIK